MPWGIYSPPPGGGGSSDHDTLSNVSADDHHAKSHAHDGADGSGTVAHSALTGVTANQHHNQAHTLTGADHTLSGLTTGHVYTATGATSAAFQAPAGGGGGGTVIASPAVRVAHSSDQSISNNTATALAFGLERYDTDAFHDTVTNNSRLTVPAGLGGRYHIGASAAFANNATGFRQLYLRHNGGSPIAVTGVPTAAVAELTQLTVSADYDLADGDYVEVVVRQTSGGSLNVVSSSAFSPEFWMHRITDIPDGFTSTDAYASRPAAGTTGNLFLPNNSFYIERDTGSAWAPWGPIFPMTPPVDGDFAWVNQGGASVATTNGGIHLAVPAVAGHQLRIRKKAAPSTPYTITAAILGMRLSPGYFGLCWRESATGEVASLSFGFSSNELTSSKWTSESAFSTNYVNIAPETLPMGRCPMFFRIADNGTNRICSISEDGVNFIVIHSISRTDFLTADEVGFFAGTNSATNAGGMTLLSWVQT